jgi:hypothetical protein
VSKIINDSLAFFLPLHANFEKPHTDNLKLYDGLPQRLWLATVTPERRYPTLVRNQAGLQGLLVSCDGVVVGGKKLGWFKKTYFGVWLDLPLEGL